MIDFEADDFIDDQKTEIFCEANDVRVSFGGERFISIIHFNIRSIRKNYDNLLLCLQSIGCDNLNVIILSEY